ncbi:MAG: hypothetical protein M0Z31_12650 [Clostridia bacterium]|nr:hypothetical protein [Clostridia bacterium]
MTKGKGDSEGWSEVGCRWATEGNNLTDSGKEGDFGCPVCNGLEVLERPCPSCNHAMEDKGSLEDYLGPYSPSGYLNCNDAFGQFPSQEMPCLHLMYCCLCDRDIRVEVPLRNLF